MKEKGAKTREKSVRLIILLKNQIFPLFFLYSVIYCSHSKRSLCLQNNQKRIGSVGSSKYWKGEMQ